MARLEELTRGASVKGILPDGLVTVVDVKWHGAAVIELTYKDTTGRLGSELLYRDCEPTLEIATVGRPWSFDGDGNLLRLAKMNLTIRGIDVQVAHGDTFHNDKHPDLKADYALASPPFTDSDWRTLLADACPHSHAAIEPSGVR
jgi:hypothetical protein